jgi:predicted RecA/RadA family phage recombinase
MAKECELLSKEYDEIRVIPGAAAAAGEVLIKAQATGFHLVDFSAAQVSAGESAAFIIRAAKCKVAKKSGETWAVGEAIYWDAANNWFSNVAGALNLCGRVHEAAVSAAVLGYIVFDGREAFTKA